MPSTLLTRPSLEEMSVQIIEMSWSNKLIEMADSRAGFLKLVLKSGHG